MAFAQKQAFPFMAFSQIVDPSSARFSLTQLSLKTQEEAISFRKRAKRLVYRVRTSSRQEEPAIL